MTPAQRRSAASKKASRSRKKLAEARSASKSVAVGAAHADRMPSKSDQIEALLRAGTLTRAEIAAKMGCKTAFVRAVWQRKFTEARPDIKYLARKRQQPEWVEARRKRMREYMRNRYWTDPEFREAQKQIRRDSARRRRAAAHA